MAAPLSTTDPRVLRDVALGGAVGALLRVGCLAVAVAVAGDDLPGVVVVNLLGAVLLGRLVAVSLRDPRWIARAPLLATGLLGALTTFSGLVVPLALLVGGGAPGAAAAWGVGSLVAGVWLAGLGLRRGRR
ncbi:MAG TPA: CrcB family protein [Egicoccus sp.]|nr:CrcB family protein [Egicoccus sp.]HSK21723.1 CrcB family protein [Egicoccus sp.]